MSVYIKGIGNISPQKTWGDDTLLSQPLDYKGDRFLCVEPDYTQFFDIRQLRRMSRVIKMGVAAGMMALKEANITMPNGIITGTSFGCLEDTGIFLSKMIDSKEHALNPTPFIQSTHNTIGSQIALLLQCQGYNQTYTQRAFSFENALLDALMELKDNPAQSLLVGGVDEITDLSHSIQKRFGIFRKDVKSSVALVNDPQDGTMNGEGAAYFVLSGEKSEKDSVMVDSVATLYNPKRKSLIEGIGSFLGSASITAEDIDLVLVGKSGDRLIDEDTQSILDHVFPKNSAGSFKHLCGEYPTSSAFAVGLGARIIQAQKIPAVVSERLYDGPLRNVLIYNPYFGKYHSLILLRPC
ncbi:MAG: beta-ketoacyl synthase [Marivirga sp.]|nr:beta-ketoacyl synthase [Marivirga sp.]